MRVSTRKDDSGYIARAYNYRVYLNGEEITHCHTADEEKGEAHCFVYDVDGRPVRDLENDYLMKSEVKHGRVVIKKIDYNVSQGQYHIKSFFYEYKRCDQVSILRVLGISVYRRVGKVINIMGFSFNA
jgi:hypothetical protein